MLNYFQDVKPEIVDVSDTEIDIAIDVVEKQTGKANFSMGYNEVNGFSGGGGFEFINFLGKGLKLNIQYQRGLQNQINSGINQQQSSSNYANYESFSSHLQIQEFLILKIQLVFLFIIMYKVDKVVILNMIQKDLVVL